MIHRNQGQPRTGGIIVLDGPDAAGKTTLAQAMIDSVDPTISVKEAYASFKSTSKVHYEHLTYIKDNYAMWKANYGAVLRAADAARQGKLAIIDRGWISENIYSHVYRGGSKMPYDVRGFDRVLQRFGAIYVMCCPPPDFAVSNHIKSHTEREEMYAPGPEIRKVAERFFELANGVDPLPEPKDYVEALLPSFWQRPDVFRYDISAIEPIDRAAPGRQYDNLTPEQLIMNAQMRHSLFEDCLVYEKAVMSNNLVGNPIDAKVLMVGDRVNANKTGVFPFVDFGGSSRCISKIIHDLDIEEHALLWVNAYHNEAFNMLQTILDIQRGRKYIIIALGDNASQRLTELKTQHFKVIHPSYAQRFNQQMLLSAQLANILAAR